MARIHSICTYRVSVTIHPRLWHIIGYLKPSCLCDARHSAPYYCVVSHIASKPRGSLVKSTARRQFRPLLLLRRVTIVHGGEGSNRVIIGDDKSWLNRKS